MEKKKILVVDDEVDLCEILSFNLKSAGYIVDTSFSAEDAFSKLKNSYDLLLLDVMMGGISGFKLAELIRKDYNYYVPIIFITARDGIADKLTGFGVGADDYISKPFSIKEVIARIHAVLNRTEQMTKNRHLEGGSERCKVEKDERDIISGSLSINIKKRQVSISGKEIRLTKKEFQILYLLTNEPQTIFSRGDILNIVWKNETSVLERTVDVHIARLRKKLGSLGSHIVNRSGYGYCFELNAERPL